MRRALLILAAMSAIVLVVAYLTTVSVPADTVAIAEPGRPGEKPAVLGPGLHLKPFGSKVVTYSTLPATAAGEALVTPATGGEIATRFSVTASLDPGHAGEIHSALGGRTIEAFLSAQTDLMLREYASRAEAVDVLTPQFRTRASQAVVDALGKGGFAQASVSIKPPDEDTLLAAAQYLAPRKEAWKIRQAAAEALAEPGAGGSWKLQTAMGLINASDKMYSDAEKNYLDALAIEPAALPPMTELVGMYSAVKNWVRLERILDAALTSNPKSLQHINWTAVVLLKMEDYVGAERILKSGLEIEPDNATLMGNLGTLYMKMNRTDEALEVFRRAVQAAPESQQALFNLGSALAASGGYAEALPLLERAEQAGQPSLPLLETLAVVHEKMGSKDRSSAYRQRVRAMETRRDAARKGSGGSPAPKSPS